VSHRHALPAFLLDQGLTARDGTISLALIGLFNIFGSYLAGHLGGRFSKTYLLSAVYALRGVAIALLISFPLTPVSAYLFAAAMGFLWLGTVPLTNGVVAGIFGVKHLAMLSGFVFFFHQLGSFFGGWLGGYVFDHAGSYQIVWLIAIGLSVISVVANLPIDERAAGAQAGARHNVLRRLDLAEAQRQHQHAVRGGRAPERFEAAARAGFKGVEIQFPYGWSQRQLAEIAWHAGVEVVLINLPGETRRRATVASPACRAASRSSARASVRRSTTLSRSAASE